MIRIVLIILTAIFMFAAGGKLWLVATDPFADIKLGFPLSVIWLAIAVEFALSYVNLRTILRPPRSFPILPLAWLATTMFVVILLAISVSRWAMGYVSCGCFGVFELPIWATPLFSSLANIALAVCFPGGSAITKSFHQLSTAIGLLRVHDVDQAEFMKRRASLVGTISGVAVSCLVIGIALVPGWRHKLLPGLVWRTDDCGLASPICKDGRQ